MSRQVNSSFQTSKKERTAYCLFFLGQNILWGYAGYIETFLTDIGITAVIEQTKTSFGEYFVRGKALAKA
jgi:hypothetical protein